MRRVNVGVLGVGTVGGGVLSVLARKGERIARALGAEVVVKRALVRDPDQGARRRASTAPC